MNNIQAFPFNDGYENTTHEGMTLRDYFAGQIICGIASRPYLAKQDAKKSYEIADAMLKERSKCQG